MMLISPGLVHVTVFYFFIVSFDGDEDDVMVLDFLRLPPTHLSHKELSDKEQRYKHAEAKYWQVENFMFGYGAFVFRL